MKRTVSVLLCLMLLFSFCLAGCSADTPSDEVLIAAATQLLPASEVINHILFESDIPEKMLGQTAGNYYEADPSFLRPYNLSTLDDIRKYAETVFSQAAVAQLFRVAVDPVSDGTTLVQAAYLYDSNGVLMVSRDGRHTRCDKTTFDLSTLTVISKTKAGIAALSVEATVTGEDGTGQTRTKRINLIYEGGRWLLDGLTCMTLR